MKLQVSTFFKQINSEATPSPKAHTVALIFGTEGCWFHPQLGQYSFRGLMIVTATRFIPLSPLWLFQQGLCGKAVNGLERILYRALVKRTPIKHRQMHWPPRYN